MANDDDKTNAKFPYSPHHDNQGQMNTLYADWCYQWEVCHNGTHYVKYRDPQGMKNFDSTCGPTGECEYDDQNGGKDKSVSSGMYPNAHRHYAQNGSKHHDKNYEKFTGGVGNKNTKGQNSKTTPKDDMDGASNNSLALFGNEGRIRKSGGSNHVNASDNGIHIQTSQGESYNYHACSRCTTCGGDQYHISQGDVGHHIQNGKNYDVKAEGKLQMQTGKGELRVKSGSTMMINAQSKITVQVGGSTITVESGQVTIKSQKITLDGESHIGGQGGQLAGTCGGGCASKVYVT